MRKILHHVFATLFVVISLLIPLQINSFAIGHVLAEEEEYYPWDIFENTTRGSEYPAIADEVYVYDGAVLTMEGGDHDFQNIINVSGEGSKVILKEGNDVFEGDITVSGNGSKMILENGDHVFKGSVSAYDNAEFVFKKGNYTFENDISFGNGAKLTIEKGANIKFKKTSNYTPSLSVYGGIISALGSQDERITFSPADEASNDYQISISGYVKDQASIFDHVDFIGGGRYWEGVPQASILNMFIKTAHAETMMNGFPTISVTSAMVQISNSKFSKGNYYPISNSVYLDNYGVLNPSFLKISDTDFVDNQRHLAVNSQMICTYNANACYKRVTLENNWYGSAEGPRTEDNPERGGDFVSGPAAIIGWSSEMHFPEIVPVEASNVLFLPGFKASRLYKDGIFGAEDKLWPPNYGGNDMKDLSLDKNGASINNVYTRDALEEVAVPKIGGNIYKTFIENLAELKNDKVINDYGVFAYDWRKNVEDVVQLGTLYESNEVRFAVAEAKKLADSSKSKKVTIIAHSNGGLVAKSVMLELGRLGLADKVDKIVFVASPQMGTPLATLSMLYGYDESAIFGSLISRADARALAENMPGAYGLLPSQKYFERLENPFINFSSENTRYKKFKDAFGEDIDSAAEFGKFLSGEGDGREKPEKNEVEIENVLNKNLLQQAAETHQRLDNWTPPANVEVIQIAGWGLDTISGVEYKEMEDIKCHQSVNSKVPTCTGMGVYKPIYDPKWTVDGDEVVVAPSALMMKEEENVKKYWVDLWSQNKGFNINRKHKDILEVNSLQKFLLNVIANTYQELPLPENIKTSRPDPDGYENAKPRLRMSLYSPLDIHLYDDFENHTGPKKIMIDGQEKTIFEQGIPNSYYYEFGERKYVGVPGGQHVRMVMEGYADGAYSLKIEEIRQTENGEETVAHTTFENLPVSSDTEVALDFPETGLESLSDLEADYDGDGAIDYALEPVANGTATLADTASPIINMASPENKQYLNNQKIDISFSVSDNVSQMEKIVIEKYLDGQKTDLQSVDLSLQKLGDHTLKIVATDEAKNVATMSVSFSISTNVQALIDNVKKYHAEGLIKNRQEKNMLLIALSVIEQRLEFLEMIRKNPHIGTRAKKLVQGVVVEQIENHVDFLLKQIGRNGKGYDSMVKQLLLENLQWIKQDVSAKFGK